MIELNGFSLKTIHIPTKINPAYKSTSETTPQGKDGIIESNKDTWVWAQNMTDTIDILIK